MFLLDSDSLTHYLQAHEPITDRVHAHSDDDIGTTIITKGEILRGRIEYLIKAENRENFLIAQDRYLVTERALKDFFIATLTNAAIDHWERLQKTKGVRNIGRADLLIASIVLAEDATLVTSNQRHFRLVPHLRTENWMK
jgi:tRNA(fMet)-specific endonuclease VapC